MVPRYQTKSFMFRGNYLVVNILSHNIIIPWVGIKQIMVSNTSD